MRALRRPSPSGFRYRSPTPTITLIPDELARPIQVGGWRPEGTARAAFEALVNALQFMVDAIIWFLIYTLPQLLLVVGALYLLWRWVGRRLYAWGREVVSRRRSPAAVEERSGVEEEAHQAI
ncbi:MAG: hypothetical protein ACLFU8_16885 [Anaerolineales bacterium]